MAAALEEPPLDGTCDECEPDVAPGAERVCGECGFCLCGRHAEAHGRRFPAHALADCAPGAGPPAWSAGEEALGRPDGDLDSDLDDDGEDEDCETDGDSAVADASDDFGEEDMEDERGSEADEADEAPDGGGEPGAGGETEAEREFDPEIEMEAERVAQRTCPEHGLDLSTYCQQDQQLICVLCPVVGGHRGHCLATLDEAFEELRSKDSGRLKAAMIELVERLKFKSSDPKVSRDQMKVFIQQEFKKVQKIIAAEEQRTLHLVDIQEAMATAHVTEILADIQSHMDRLMTQMAQAKEQHGTSDESADPKAEGGEEEHRLWKTLQRHREALVRSKMHCPEWSLLSQSIGTAEVTEKVTKATPSFTP